METLFNKAIKTKEFWSQFNQKVAKFKFKSMEQIEKITIEISLIKAVVITALIVLVACIQFVMLRDIGSGVDKLKVLNQCQFEKGLIANN